MASNVLEFYIKMKDMMSSGLAKVARNGKDSFGAVETSVNKVYSAMQRAGQSIDSYGSSLRNARNEAEKLSKASGGFGLKDLITGNLVTDLIRNSLGQARGFMTESVSKAMEFGKTNTSFEVLTGDKNKGQALAASLNKLQQDTILGPEVFKNAQMMLGFGVTADKVLPTMRMLGDVSMGDADKMSALTLAFSQVSAAGKLTGQDLLQFVNAGFNPLNEISKTTGISMSVLKQKMSDGAISAQMVENAFKTVTGEGGRFSNMMEKIAKTPAGQLAIFQGQVESFKIKLGEALMPLESAALGWLTKMLNVANQVLPYITSGVNQVLSFVNGLTSGTSEWSDYIRIAGDYANTLLDGVKYIWQVVSYIVTDFLKWIKSSELLKDLLWGVQKVGELVWWVIKNIAQLLQSLYTNIIKPILEGIEKAYRWVKDMLGFGKSEILVTSKTVAQVKGSTPTSAVGASSTGTPKASAAGADSLGSAVAKSGPRTINITMGKMIEKIEIHASNMNEGIDGLEVRIQEALLRILNSGAAVQ